MDKRKEKEIWLLNIILKTACKDEISCNGQELLKSCIQIIIILQSFV